MELRMQEYEKCMIPILTTLLDPNYKNINFKNPINASKGVEHLYTKLNNKVKSSISKCTDTPASEEQILDDFHTFKLQRIQNSSSISIPNSMENRSNEVEVYLHASIVNGVNPLLF